MLRLGTASANKSSASKNASLRTLLAPFEQLTEEKRELLREVLQIYVSRDSGKHTDLEKRRRLSAVISDFSKKPSVEED
mgnify:CR=1 FL=1